MLHRFSQLMPLLIGFALGHHFQRQIERMHDVFPALSTLCIAIICGTEQDGVAA